jgi:predicted GTPase
MNDADSAKALRLLEEIRDNLKLQMERQAEGLALQREQFALVQRQVERAERIQDRAEEIQAKSVQLVGGARKAAAILLPIIFILLGYLTWLLFRRFR